MKLILTLLTLLASPLAFAGSQAPCANAAAVAAVDFVREDFRGGPLGSLNVLQQWYSDRVDNVIYYGVTVEVEDYELNINIGLEVPTCKRVEASYIFQEDEV
ncbi:MAG: hypothetical protein KF799_05980 [Bdellovibrionales bacterium]|nr:hypothetical protein [Bdellovibrionales bacterium]